MNWFYFAVPNCRIPAGTCPPTPSGLRALNWNPAGSAGPAGRPSRAHCAVIGPPVVSTTPPHPEASPDRPGAVTVSRIVARNSGHPGPYTGTRTVLVRSSRPRGSAAAAAGGTSPRTPLRWRGPQGTRNDPDNFGSAAGGRWGCWPQGLYSGAGGPGGPQTRTRRISRGLGAPGVG